MHGFDSLKMFKNSENPRGGGGGIYPYPCIHCTTIGVQVMWVVQYVERLRMSRKMGHNGGLPLSLLYTC